VDIAGEMAGAFEALNRAATWSDFTVAVERFSAPSQNFVYADVDGNIGYAMSGRLPLRTRGVGAMPVDAAAGGADWAGSVPPSSLPRLLNPERDYIASANNLIDRTWAGVMTHDWAAPYRAARLHRWLESTPRIDTSSLSALQTDVTGGASADVLASVDEALAKAGAQGNAAAANVLSQLRAWDRRVDDRPVVTLYHLFEEAFWRRTFADEMGDALFNRFYEWAGAERPAGLYAILHEPRARWFDDIATLDRRETREDIVVLAAQDAATRMAGAFRGREAWGDVHRAHFIHPLGGQWRALGWLFNRGPVSVPGDIYTVNRASYHRLRPFDVWELASWRQIVDVGRWDDSLVALPTGQSGHPLSPHYFDQNELWRTGRYRSQPFSREAVDRLRAHRLLFTP
jgi:penicillin G amidase